MSGHPSGMSIGSIEGDGYIFMGANGLTVGTNNLNTVFSGVIFNNGLHGSLAKVGSGLLTLQNFSILTVGLSLVSGSIIKLDFIGAPDIASLVVNGVGNRQGCMGA